MKRIALLIIAAGLVQSCASIKALPEKDLEARVNAVLDGPSHVDPLEVTIWPDYVGERLTLVRTVVVTTQNGNTSSQEAPDEPLGFYFGNGLYWDDSGNISVLVDKLAGVGPDFVGTTEYHYHPPMDQVGINRTATFTGSQISVLDPGPLLFSKKYTINKADKKAAVWLTPMTGRDVHFQNDGKVKVVEQMSLNPLGGTTYEKTTNGAKKSWWELAVLVPFVKSVELTQTKEAVTDNDKRILVQNTGTYLRFAYTKGDQYSYRIYRTPTMVVLLDETKGTVQVFKKTPTGLEWQQRLEGLMQVMTDKNVDYSLKVIPAQP